MEKDESRPATWHETCIDMRENEQGLLEEANAYQKLYDQALIQCECALDDKTRGIEGWHTRLVQADIEANDIAREQRMYLANVLAYRTLVHTLEELQQKSDDAQFIGESLIHRISAPRFFKTAEQVCGEFLAENEHVRLPPPTHWVVQIAKKIVHPMLKSPGQAVDD